jgi:hypothetical protein
MRVIYHTFKEVIAQKSVLLYEDDYKDIRDGTGNHTGAHPEIETDFDLVTRAIEDSDIVCQDRGNRSKRCYYCKYPGLGMHPNQHMKVIIKKRFSGKMEVVTAYFTNVILEKKILWKRI